jgi:thiol-disulfide isomerase/thioredoxin
MVCDKNSIFLSLYGKIFCAYILYFAGSNMIHSITSYIKKHWSTLLLGLILVLLLIPATGIPIKVFINRMIAFSPSLIDVEDQKRLSTYNWELESLEGRKVNFKQSIGKVVVVNFWATWCPPCLAEMPSLQNLYDQFGDQIDFYFVTNEPLDQVNSFLKQKGYSIPIYQSSSNLPKELFSQSLPTTYMISKEGEIIMDETGAAQWDSKKVVDFMYTLLK